MKIIKDFQMRLEKKKKNSAENRIKYDIEIHIDISFVMQNNLIYHKKRCRLFISKFLKKNMFEFVYDQNQHFEINRCYKQISESFYIFHFSRKLRQYVIHCFQC